MLRSQSQGSVPWGGVRVASVAAATALVGGRTLCWWFRRAWVAAEWLATRTFVARTCCVSAPSPQSRVAVASRAAAAAAAGVTAAAVATARDVAAAADAGAVVGVAREEVAFVAAAAASAGFCSSPPPPPSLGSVRWLSLVDLHPPPLLAMGDPSAGGSNGCGW